MKEREKPSWVICVFGPLLFLLGSAAALLWFICQLIELLNNFNSEIVSFDKGAFYMLGVGIGMSVLSIVTVQEGWLGRTLSKKQSAILTRLAVIGFFLLFTLPHFVHYFVDSYLSSRGYSVCEKASRQWLFVRYVVYIKDTMDCVESLKKQ